LLVRHFSHHETADLELLMNSTRWIRKRLLLPGVIMAQLCTSTINAAVEPCS